MSCMWPWPLVVNEICFWKLMIAGSLYSVEVKGYFQTDVYGRRLARLERRIESPHGENFESIFVKTRANGTRYLCIMDTAIHTDDHPAHYSSLKFFPASLFTVEGVY